MASPTGYTLRDVRALLKLSRGVVLGFVEAGFVHPARGSHNEYRFDFADLVALRVAQELVAAQLPPQRILRTLRHLRRQLPSQAPRRPLRIEAIGDRVVVCDGTARWSPDSGQYLLALDVRAPQGDVRFLPATPIPDRAAATQSPQRWTPKQDSNGVTAARADYEAARKRDEPDAAAYVNFGLALHEAGRLAEAREIYEQGIANAPEDALLRFNLGVLLEDLGEPQAAEKAYCAAVRADARLADAHYNLALLYESLAKPQLALRHFNAYRQLQRQGHR